MSSASRNPQPTWSEDQRKDEPRRPGTYLCIKRCPEHRDLSISLDIIDTDKETTGMRVTPGKCCGGRREMVAQWKVDARELVQQITRNALVEWRRASLHDGGELHAFTPSFTPPYVVVTALCGVATDLASVNLLLDTGPVCEACRSHLTSGDVPIVLTTAERAHILRERTAVGPKQEPQL